MICINIFLNIIYIILNIILRSKGEREGRGGGGQSRCPVMMRVLVYALFSLCGSPCRYFMYLSGISLSTFASLHLTSYLYLHPIVINNSSRIIITTSYVKTLASGGWERVRKRLLVRLCKGTIEALLRLCEGPTSHTRPHTQTHTHTTA
jgi:hypothetical protein